VAIAIDEDHPEQPINPYGASKWMVERMLKDYSAAYGLRWVALRYFNAAGVDPDGELGERHEPETHIIPNVLQAASGRKAAITLNGRDYPTADGTPVRDYIHVCDLCDAHSRALGHIQAGYPSEVFNLGTGQSYSIQEILDTAAEVTGQRIPVEEGQRRPGDPARLVADATRAREMLQWSPQFGLSDILRHAWSWERAITGTD